MAMTVNSMTFDCADAHQLARFWAALTGWVVFFDDDPEVMVAPHFPALGPTMLFIPVPEGKTAKNRLHLDLQPSDRTRDAARPLRLVPHGLHRRRGRHAAGRVRQDP